MFYPFTIYKEIIDQHGLVWAFLYSIFSNEVLFIETKKEVEVLEKEKIYEELYFFERQEIDSALKEMKKESDINIVTKNNKIYLMPKEEK